MGAQKLRRRIFGKRRMEDKEVELRGRIKRSFRAVSVTTETRFSRVFKVKPRTDNVIECNFSSISGT